MVGIAPFVLLAGTLNLKENGVSFSAGAFGRCGRTARRKSLSCAAKTSSSSSGVAAAAMSSARTERTSRTSNAVKLFASMAIVVRQARHKPIHHEVTVACAERQEKSPWTGPAGVEGWVTTAMSLSSLAILALIVASPA
jgi:hypothetical protein